MKPAWEKSGHVQVFMVGKVSYLKDRNSRQLSAGKIMASVFLDSEVAIHVDFLSHGLTINADITVTCFVVMSFQQFGRKCTGNCPRSSYSMTMLVHLQQISQ